MNMKTAQSRKDDNTTYLDVKMVSEYLHFARSTIYKWVEERYIPHKKLGKRVLFIKTDIDRWVENNGMIAVDDLPELPKFIAIGKDNPEESQDTIRDINQQHSGLGNINFKYRSAS
jgi:excisionase family DNA binding protein